MIYILVMNKSESILIRVEPKEKEAFKKAAELAGLPVSMWIRERLRRITRIELQDAGEKVPFIKQQ